MRPPVSPAPALVVALVVALAGCAGAGTVPGPTPTRTLTPAPVPTEAPGPERLAPGLSSAGVDDPTALRAAHGAGLGDAWLLRIDQTVRYADGTLRSRLGHAVRTNDTRVHLVHEVAGPGAYSAIGSPPVRGEFWFEEGRVLAAVTDGGSTAYAELTYSQARYYAFEFTYLVPKGRLFPLLGALETRVDGRRVRDGTARYRVVATRVVRPTAFEEIEGVTAPRDVRLEAVVDERGVVRRYSLSYTARLRGATVRVSRTVRFAALDGSLRRPSWYDEVDNGSAFNASNPRTDLSTP